MRGADTFTESLFTMRKLEVEDVVPARHPLREIRETANAALDKLRPMLKAYVWGRELASTTTTPAWATAANACSKTPSSCWPTTPAFRKR